MKIRLYYLKYIIIALIMTMITKTSYSQHGYSGPIKLSINNQIFIGGKYTKAEIIKKFGTPTHYTCCDSEFGLDESYYYGNNLFVFAENGVFVGFSVYDNRYAVINDNLIFKVGSFFDTKKIRSIPNMNAIYYDNRRSGDKTDFGYKVNRYNSDDYLDIKVDVVHNIRFICLVSYI